MSKEQYILVIIAAIIFAWWFRYDTHCSGTAWEHNIPCVAYDRFTGKWIFPSELIEQKDN